MPACSFLDNIMPTYDVSEDHDIWIAASPERAWEAMQHVNLEEIRLLGFLFMLRSVPMRLRRTTIPEQTPDCSLYDLLLDTGFVVVMEDEPHEVVLGHVAKFWRLSKPAIAPLRSGEEFLDFNRPGWNKAAMNLCFRPTSGGTHLRTETRVISTDAGARRRFRLYWTVVMPGSVLIRRSWLAAIKRRAELANRP